MHTLDPLAVQEYVELGGGVDLQKNNTMGRESLIRLAALFSGEKPGFASFAYDLTGEFAKNP